MKKAILFILTFMFFTSCGGKIQQASNPVILRPIEFRENILNIGSEWSRKSVVKTDMEQYTAVQRKTFKAIAKIDGVIGSGTAFYLGKFEGEYLFATNHHVIPTSGYCSLFTTITLFSGERVTCKWLLSSWADVEIAFFTVRANVEAAAALERLTPLHFEFSRHIRSQERLLSAGFGIHGNKERKLTYINDEFCMIASDYKDYRKITGPKATTSVVSTSKEKKTWSFMHGCEGSHGDSGSPLVSRYSGKILGVYWGGKTPKGMRLTNNEYVSKSIRNRRNKVIWNKLNMGVPSFAIQKKIIQYLKKNITHNKLKKSIYTSLIR